MSKTNYKEKLKELLQSALAVRQTKIGTWEVVVPNDAIAAILALNREYIQEDEPVATSIDGEPLSKQAPIVVWGKGRNSIRKQLRQEMGGEDE